MTILEIDDEQLTIASVEFTNSTFIFVMKDGRRIEAPLWWYPRLYSANSRQRNNWEILPFGDGVTWADIDEHISAKGVIIGGAAPGAKPPAEAAE